MSKKPACPKHHTQNFVVFLMVYPIQSLEKLEATDHEMTFDKETLK